MSPQLGLPFPVRVVGGACVWTPDGWQFEADAAPVSLIAGGGVALPPRIPMMLAGRQTQLPVPCEGCSTDFYPKRRDVRFCSHACAARTGRARRFWTTRKPCFEAAAE